MNLVIWLLLAAFLMLCLIVWAGIFGMFFYGGCHLVARAINALTRVLRK